MPNQKRKMVLDKGTTIMLCISQKTGVDAKTIRSYRKRVPGEIAVRARMPQRFLFEV